MIESLNTGATVNTGASGGSSVVRRSAPEFPEEVAKDTVGLRRLAVMASGLTS